MIWWADVGWEMLRTVGEGEDTAAGDEGDGTRNDGGREEERDEEGQAGEEMHLFRCQEKYCADRKTIAMRHRQRLWERIYKDQGKSKGREVRQGHGWIGSEVYRS